MLSERERRFLATRMVGYLATSDRRAIPHVVPVCFVLLDTTLYITVDEKPKRDPRRTLKRIRNIEENPNVAVLADRYDDDWTLLGWVMLRGHAKIVTGGKEHQHAQSLLRARYHQLHGMQIADLSVIAIRLERALSWGNLSVDDSMPPAGLR
jgi:PPOX class probable F420-dependent enzyme